MGCHRSHVSGSQKVVSLPDPEPPDARHMNPAGGIKQSVHLSFSAEFRGGIGRVGTGSFCCHFNVLFILLQL